MINPLKWFKRSKPTPELGLLSPEIQDSIDAVLAPPPPKPRGRIVKNTKSAEFNPSTGRRGGRIVKAMPRQLQKIKAAQEQTEDDI